MEVNKKLIQTEAGLLPNDWDYISLEGKLHIAHGFAFQSQFFKQDGDYLLTTPGHFYETGGFKDIGEKQKVLFRPVPSGYILEENDVIVAMTEQADGLLGSTAIIPESGKYLHNQRLGRLKPISKELSIQYLYWVFNSKYYRSKVRETSVGTKVKHTSPNKLLEIPIPIPKTKKEQEAIANALSDTDAYIESLEKLIAKKRLIKKGVMQELFTGKRRLDGFNSKLQTKKLGEIAFIKTGSRNNQDKIENGLYPFFVRSAFVERINSYSHDCEAILVPGEGNIGSIFHYINGRFDVHQRVYAITKFSPEVSAKYIYLYMSEKFGAHAMENSVKATVDSLRLPTFLNFEIQMPELKEEQEAIAITMTDMELEIKKYEDTLQKARLVKQGMMQELLTGRIRLV